MKRIMVFEGATIVYDPKIKKQGITFESNTEFVKDVEATAKNRKKYLKESDIINKKEEITSR